MQQMQFEQTVRLAGVVGKKASGTLDNGQAWATDRVELHCITPFPESDSMAHGSTVTLYQVQDYAAHYEPAKQLIGQNVILQMQMEPAKKLGQAPRVRCVGFKAQAAGKAS